MEQPREESKIAFEVIPLLKSQREDDCLLCLASHHSQTLAFDALVTMQNYYFCLERQSLSRVY